MTSIDSWSLWVEIFVLGLPILLAYVGAAYSLYLSYRHQDAIKEALKNSHYIYLLGSSLGKRGLIWCLFKMSKIAGMRGQTTLGDHPKLKTALGISSRSLVHHWDKAGAPGQIPGYATHVDATSRAANYMKTGGYIAIGIGGVSSLLAIQEVCNGDSVEACERVKFVEGGKFGLSTLGGALGGAIASSASGSICMAIGISTGGIGGVVCVAAIVGAGTWAGTTVGDMAGEALGEKFYQATQP